MTHRIRFSTARQVFEAFPTAAQDVELAPADETPLEFARKLLAPDRRYEAIVYLAYLLPRREAVWWGCQCVRAAGADSQPEMLAAAEAWVRDPTERTQREALALGWAGDLRKAGAWLALAAGQSGGSLAPDGAPRVAPPPQATALCVKAAIVLAVTNTPASGQFAWLSACVEAGLRFAEGGDAKVHAPRARAQAG